MWKGKSSQQVRQLKIGDVLRGVSWTRGDTTMIDMPLRVIRVDKGHETATWVRFGSALVTRNHPVQRWAIPEERRRFGYRGPTAGGRQQGVC